MLPRALLSLLGLGRLLEPMWDLAARAYPRGLLRELWWAVA